MRKIFKSLRSRLIALILLTGLLPIVVMHFVVVSTYESRLISQRTIEIRQKCSALSDALSEYADIEDALNSGRKDMVYWYADTFGGRLLVVDSNYTIILDTYSVDKGRSCISDAVFSAFSGNEYSNYKKASHLIEYVVPVTYTEGDTRTVTGAIVFSTTTEWISESLNRVQKGMYLIESVLVLLLILVSIYLSFVIVKPVRNVAAQAEKMESGDISAAFDSVRSYEEINAILDPTAHLIRNYQEMEESQSQFISNVSHELKTPMTSIRVLSDSLIGQQNIPEEVYQEFLTDISVEVERESEIVEDLLIMSRIGRNKNSMNFEMMNVNDFVMDILKRLKPIAKQRDIELIYESFRQVTAYIDDKKLSQAFTNLIENGIKYNHDRGFVKVSLDADHEFFYVKISDNGIGIPEEALERIFDRFYRVDSDRSRETGGSGLGLYITKTIILLHGGIIKAESVPDEGTSFTVRIPLKQAGTEGGKA